MIMETEMDSRERHRLSERQRRKSMRELFLSLHALLPYSNTVRKEQPAILDEIISYIPLAVARLRTLESQRKEKQLGPTAPSSITPAVHVSDGSRPSEFNIRVASESSLPVSIRVRGDRVNISFVEAKGASSSSSSSQAVILSDALEEIEAHHLEIVRSAHCRDGGKMLHHSECKIMDGLDLSPAMLKERLQHLAWKLHNLRRPSSSVKKTDIRVVSNEPCSPQQQFRYSDGHPTSNE